MLEKIIAFFMAIIAFFANLFGISVKSDVWKNAKYGNEARQVLDLYIPKNNDGTLGLVLMIHGGAWIQGDKSDYADAIRYGSDDLGYACASINYRYISDAVHIDDILDDIDAALAFIKAKGEEKGVTIDKVLLTGASAGAHLSMLYAYARKDTAPITPAAVVSYCGPTNLAERSFYYDNAMGDTAFVCDLMSKACGFTFTMDNFAQAIPYLLKVSPITYVTANSVPTVLAHGEKDSIVPFANAREMDAKMTLLGVKHDFIVYPNSDHDLANDPEQAQIASNLLLEYAAAYLN